MAFVADGVAPVFGLDEGDPLSAGVVVSGADVGAGEGDGGAVLVVVAEILEIPLVPLVGVFVVFVEPFHEGDVVVGGLGISRSAGEIEDALRILGGHEADDLGIGAVEGALVGFVFGVDGFDGVPVKEAVFGRVFFDDGGEFGVVEAAGVGLFGDFGKDAGADAAAGFGAEGFEGGGEHVADGAAEASGFEAAGEGEFLHVEPDEFLGREAAPVVVEGGGAVGGFEGVEEGEDFVLREIGVAEESSEAFLADGAGFLFDEVPGFAGVSVEAELVDDEPGFFGAFLDVGDFAIVAFEELPGFVRGEGGGGLQP